MPHLAANLSMMFTELTFAERFQAAADAGFEAVEFLFPYDWPADDIARWREAAGVEIVLFNLPPGAWEAGDRGLAALPGRRAEFRASVTSAIGYAKAFGTKRLHVMAGIANAKDVSQRAAYLDNLRLASDLAARDGIGLLIEPLNPRDMPGYFLSGFDLAAELLDELGCDNVRLQFDIYHRQILCGDVLAGLERLLPRIGHIQIAAVPSRAEPGSGELNDFRILNALDDMGYEGFVGCEYRPAGSTLGGLEWIDRWRGA
ncbi:2-oxo-tetronate isomerase [Hoeflea sp.]|uniref:2-oxo-tetronate isomerase n=1 Tax=Hoeflea sp. TaxID=1940281 RepID=UPI003BB14AD6